MNENPLPNPIKVLIVEDEAAIAIEIEMRVTAMGHVAVGPAATGDRALAIAERERPDLALIDVNIAGSQDGVEVAAELRRRLGLPAIFVTAYSSPELVARAKSTQPLAWIMKPFGERELQIAIELGLHRHAAEQALRDANQRLEQALAKVKLLSGLLPICSSCKRVRDDRDYWQSVEQFVAKHSEVRFSHGFCPQCYRDQMKTLGLEEAPGTSGP